jgi:hypothetical protein
MSSTGKIAGSLSFKWRGEIKKMLFLLLLSLRSEPTTKAKIISTLKAGQKVSKIGERDHGST